jgi:hypothetical protein
MDKKSAVFALTILLLVWTLIPPKVFGQATSPSPPSPPCSTCVSGGGTPGTLPVFATGSTTTRGQVMNSTLSQDAKGNTIIGPLVNGEPTGSIRGLVGRFKGVSGGVLGWDTDIAPNIFPVGVFGFVDNTDGSALFGRANATTGSARGVTGRSLSSDGFGVIGRAGPDPTTDNPNPAGSATGVLGVSTTTVGIGVIGRSSTNIGVLGEVTEQTPIGVGNVIGVLGQTATTSGLTEGVSGLVYSPNGTAGVFRNRGGGDILVGEGPIEGPHLFRFDGQGNLFLVGVLQMNSGNADLAERIETKELLEAGDVIEIDPTATGRFRKSTTRLSTRVAGIVSSAPAITLASRGDIKRGAESDKRPVLALAGTVPVKVTNEAGRIQVGDLLTTSSTPGFAMRCADRVACIGAILGKALEPLSDQTGVVRALVTLQ